MFIFEAPPVIEKKAQPAKDPMKNYTKYQKELHRRILASNDQETVEDFELAMEVLNRYQKDRNYLKKEANEIKQKGALDRKSTRLNSSH